MRAVRPLCASALAAAGSTLVVLACSTSDPREDTRFPRNNGGSSGGASTSSGGSSSGTTSSGGDASDGEAPDASIDDASDASTCAPLPAQIDMVNIDIEPTETGGTLVDGTFFLTKAEVAEAGGDGSPIGKKKAAVLVFAGNKVTWHWDRDMVLREPEDKCCDGTFSVINGNELNFNLTCDGLNVLIVTGYTVLGATEIRVQYGGEMDTFTKQ